MYLNCERACVEFLSPDNVTLNTCSEGRANDCMLPVHDIADLPRPIATDIKATVKDVNTDMTNYLWSSVSETLSAKL